MMFIGQNIDYTAAYLPNLPMWTEIFNDNVASMKLIVATLKDESGDICACCVRQVFIDSLENIDGEFNPVVSIGNFGSYTDDLMKFADDVANGFTKKEN